MQAPRRASRTGAALLTAAAFVVVVAGMRAAEALIVPLLLSIFIAIVAGPPVFWLERKGLPRILAMLGVLAALVAVALGLSALVGRSVRQFTASLPQYKSRLAEETQGLLQWMSERGIPVQVQEIMDMLDPGAAIQLAGDIFNGFGGVLANAFLIFLTVIFILFEAHSFPRKLHSVLDDAAESLRRFDSFSDSLNRYLVIKSLASLGTGAVIAIWLWAMGVEFFLLWGLLAFMLNYVPNIGSVIAAVPAVLFAYIQLGPGAALWTGVGFVVVNVVVGSIIEPRFMGRGLGLSTLVVFISLVFWGWVLGPVGMFLSVPLTMTAKIALDTHEDTRWIAVMLGPETSAPEIPEASPEDEHDDNDNA